MRWVWRFIRGYIIINPKIPTKTTTTTKLRKKVESVFRLFHTWSSFFFVSSVLIVCQNLDFKCCRCYVFDYWLFVASHCQFATAKSIFDHKMLVNFFFFLLRFVFNKYCCYYCDIHFIVLWRCGDVVSIMLFLIVIFTAHLYIKYINVYSHNGLINAHTTDNTHIFKIRLL